MTRVTRTRVLVALGTALLTAALALVVRALLADGAPAAAGAWRAVLVLLAVAGVAVAAWRLRARPPAEDATDDRDGGYRRAGRYRLVASAPERTAAAAPLAGHESAALLARATEVARRGDVEDGVAVVRPTLRDVLVDALVAGGADRVAAVRTVDRGTWTDDPEAAAVLSASIDPPSRSFLDRLRAWLRPGRAARERIDRAVAAVAAASDDALPPVPGRTAPRRATVSPPPLATLQRDVDGALRPAVAPGSGTPVPPSLDGEPTPADGEPAVPDDATDRSADDATGRSGDGDPMDAGEPGSTGRETGGPASSGRDDPGSSVEGEP